MSNVTVHLNVTHPDGEYDLADLVLPEETETEKVRDLAIAEYGHLFVPGDVIDLTIEGQFAPFDSFTHEDHS
jgi:hypothetical protein